MGGHLGVQSADVSEPRDIVATHLPGLDERSRPTVERLIDLILGVLTDTQHERKWGHLTFTREADWHQWICAISPTKKAVKLVIHKGALLADPRGVMEGEGRLFARHPLPLPRTDRRRRRGADSARVCRPPDGDVIRRPSRAAAPYGSSPEGNPLSSVCRLPR
jgi:hypothetical protein